MIRGGLVTKRFLIEGIIGTEAWVALSTDRLAELHARLCEVLAAIPRFRRPTEAETEAEVIRPVLGILGWEDTLLQQNLSAKGRSDVPDMLLFRDRASLEAAARLHHHQRYRQGLCVVESKRWERPLDREEKGSRADGGVPSTQMLRYLRRVEDLAGGALRWGILTNGRLWRLYWQGAASVAEGFFEVDLAKALGEQPMDFIDRLTFDADDDAAARAHALKLFVLFFGRSAFLADVAGRSFHQLALAQGQYWVRQVTGDLSNIVFDHVFPTLADALVKADPQRDPDLGPVYLDTVKHGVLVLLYRLLFVLYAEDRDLLPANTPPYADFALKPLRVEIAAKRAAGHPQSSAMATIWSRFKGIFGAIAKGDDELGIPPYNGGLFATEAAPILERVQLSNAVMADVIFRLSHQEDRQSGRDPAYINYRDLSVRHLGGVYERILEHGLRPSADGTIEVAQDESARKDSGSYYTPDELVMLIIDRSVGPLAADRLKAFHDAADRLASDPRPTEERLQALQALDPACRLLDLKICDPAMGSGHFLVNLVDWLADRVLTAMADASVLADWAGYVSPLAARIAGIREEIEDNARTHDWPVRDGHLDDRHIVRRMILKRVIHGVDKNRMAVELAKVALWLHSFTVGAPLSFLNHHLRWGDSVVGAWVRPTLDDVRRRGALFNGAAIRRVEQAAAGMAQVEQSNDSDLAAVKRSEVAFGAVEDDTAPVAAFFSLLTAERILGVLDHAPKKAPPSVSALRKAGKSAKQIAKAEADHAAFERAAAWRLMLDGTFGDPMRIALGEERVAPPDGAPGTDRGDARRRRLADELVDEARRLADHHRFLHWEIAFPNIWTDLTADAPVGGFDAVIGNPPYVRQELLSAIKPALKPRDKDAGPPTLAAQAGYAAFDGMADLYVYFYEQGLRLLRPGGRMGYVVTNKWLKAGYGEALRGLFAAAWVEFVADFGHAKHFFPEADVFPSVLVVCRPDGSAPPETAAVCVIPREEVPAKGLAEAVERNVYPLPRAVFTRESWTLEPPAVMALLDRIRRNGVPLADYAGVKPLNGIKTGLNEAFLIDTPTRDSLIRDDPLCAALIKPYLRGQDVERWRAPDSGLHMILLKSSGDHPWPWATAATETEAEALFRRTYPSLHAHMKQFETMPPENGKPKGLRHREDHGRF
ncbi:hypothetical protein [Azospirillum largimobile]